MTSQSKIRLYVNDLEQKTLFLVVPMVSIAVTVAWPFASFWIGSAVPAIAVTIAVVVSSHLLFSSTITPYYQYLVAKGYAFRTITLQSVNVGANALLLLLLYPLLGYPAAVGANALAILSSCCVALIFQRGEFGLRPFLEPKTLEKLLLALVGSVGGGVLILLIPMGVAVAFALILVIVPSTALYLYRLMEVMSLDDIRRYFGANGTVSRFLQWLLVAPTRT